MEKICHNWPRIDTDKWTKMTVHLVYSSYPNHEEVSYHLTVDCDKLKMHAVSPKSPTAMTEGN
jgi:hypothetical protein